MTPMLVFEPDSDEFGSPVLVAEAEEALEVVLSSLLYDWSEYRAR